MSLCCCCIAVGKIDLTTLPTVESAEARPGAGSGRDEIADLVGSLGALQCTRASEELELASAEKLSCSGSGLPTSCFQAFFGSVVDNVLSPKVAFKSGCTSSTIS